MQSFLGQSRKIATEFMETNVGQNSNNYETILISPEISYNFQTQNENLSK